MKAAFLDRDGVIINNSTHYYIYKTKDVVFVDGIFENLFLLREKGFELFVVSNQGGVAKKQYSKEDVEKVHRFVRKTFEKHGILIKDMVYCPHHDSIEKCICRKPSPLMIEKLIAKYNIDICHSIMIGDSQRDIEAARQAGVKGILIPSNQNMYPLIEEVLKT